MRENKRKYVFLFAIVAISLIIFSSVNATKIIENEKQEIENTGDYKYKFYLKGEITSNACGNVWIFGPLEIPVMNNNRRIHFGAGALVEQGTVTINGDQYTKPLVEVKLLIGEVNNDAGWDISFSGTGYFIKVKYWEE